MGLYAIILLGAAIALLMVGALIYRDNTNLIHSDHQARVTDHTKYAKAFGRAIMGLSAPLIASGVAALFGESMLFAILLFAGLAVVIRVQRKYNGGVF